MAERIGKLAYWAFLSLALAVVPAQSAQRGYTVQAGDTPCEIAERFGMRCVDLMAIISATGKIPTISGGMARLLEVQLRSLEFTQR